jgi:hypothetical protein
MMRSIDVAEDCVRVHEPRNQEELACFISMDLPQKLKSNMQGTTDLSELVY